MEGLMITAHLGFSSSDLALHTTYSHQFIDITDEVARRLRQSTINQGLAVVTSQHTTAAILVNEHEPELLKDLSRMLNEMAPPDDEYAHNRVPCGPQESANGHAHCQALLLSASATIPISAGSLLLGRYQRIFLVELDCPRPRRISVTLLGA